MACACGMKWSKWCTPVPSSFSIMFPVANLVVEPILRSFCSWSYAWLFCCTHDAGLTTAAGARAVPLVLLALQTVQAHSAAACRLHALSWRDLCI